MNKIDSKYIDVALEKLNDINNILESDNDVLRNNKSFSNSISYAASFGAFVIINGFEGALYMYSNVSDASKRDQILWLMTHIVDGVLVKEKENTEKEAKKGSMIKNKGDKRNSLDIYKKFLKDGQSQESLRDRYVNASIALKLVLRTYEQNIEQE